MDITTTKKNHFFAFFFYLFQKNSHIACLYQRPLTFRHPRNLLSLWNVMLLRQVMSAIWAVLWRATQPLILPGTIIMSASTQTPTTTSLTCLFTAHPEGWTQRHGRVQGCSRKPSWLWWVLHQTYSQRYVFYLNIN